MPRKTSGSKNFRNCNCGWGFECQKFRLEFNKLWNRGQQEEIRSGDLITINVFARIAADDDEPKDSKYAFQDAVLASLQIDPATFFKPEHVAKTHSVGLKIARHHWSIPQLQYFDHTGKRPSAPVTHAVFDRLQHAAQKSSPYQCSVAVGPATNVKKEKVEKNNSKSEGGKTTGDESTEDATTTTTTEPEVLTLTDKDKKWYMLPNMPKEWVEYEAGFSKVRPVLPPGSLIDEDDKKRPAAPSFLARSKKAKATDMAGLSQEQLLQNQWALERQAMQSEIARRDELIAHQRQTISTLQEQVKSLQNQVSFMHHRQFPYVPKPT